MTNAEIDRAVAEKVMGWSEFADGYWLNGSGILTGYLSVEPVFHQNDNDEPLQSPPQIAGTTRWSPSSNISDAWQVLEKMRADDNWFVEVRAVNGTEWYVQIGASEGAIYPNACIGICLAALRAIGIDTEGAPDGVA